jgi:putative flippase GtrA
MKNLIEGVAFPKQAIRFLCIGGGITLFDWAMFMLLSSFISPSAAFIISYTLAVLVRFWLDKKITFAVKDGNWRWQLFRYFLSCGITFCISFVAFELARYLGVPQFPAKVFSTGCGTIFGFCLFKFFVFARSFVWARSPERIPSES